MRKGLVFGGVILALAAVTGIGLMVSTSGEGRPSPERSDSDWEELVAILEKIRRTWKPEPKARVLERAAERVDALRSPLLDLLSRPSHHLVVEAVQLAAVLDVREAHAAIVSLAENGPQSVRPAAILAAERFKPWGLPELVGFLQEDRPCVIIAALAVSSSRVDRPLLEILDLFGYEDPRVRKAASSAVPYEMEPEVLDQLLAVARTATEDQALWAIRALSRTKPVAEVETFLVEQLEAPEPLLRLAALDALTVKGSPLTRPTVVWNFVVDEYRDPTERAKAFVCLERTRSFEVFEIRESLPDLHPYLRYFAARCLISAGEREGVGVLLDLLTTDMSSFGDVEEAKVTAVLHAARKLLAYLSEIAPHAKEERWRQWYGECGPLRTQTLAPPPLNL